MHNGLSEERKLMWCVNEVKAGEQKQSGSPAFIFMLIEV